MIVSTCCTSFQQVDCVVSVVWVDKGHVCKTDIRVGENLALKVVVRLVDFHVHLRVTHKLWLICKQSDNTSLQCTGNIQHLYLSQ